MWNVINFKEICKWSFKILMNKTEFLSGKNIAKIPLLNVNFLQEFSNAFLVNSDKIFTIMHIINCYHYIW